MSLARCARTVTRNMTAPRPSPVLSLLAQLPRHRSFATYPSAREEQAAAPPQPTRTPIGQIQRRLQITFTCTAEIPIEGAHAESPQSQPCHHRSTHEFSRTSYEKGIVLVECPGCKNRHLIADNLSWFSQTPSHAYPDGLPIGAPKQPRTIEQLMKEKGESVRWEDGGKDGKTWEVEG